MNVVYCKKIFPMNQVRGLVLFTLFLLNLILFNSYFLLDISFLWQIFALSFSVVTFLSLKKASYTFWISTILLLSVFFIWLISNFSFLSISERLTSLIIIIILLSVCFQLYTPIIFPIISWWEYDFRYRFDLEGYICTDDFCYLSRLNDFRRGACSIHTFGNFKVNEVIFFNYNLKGNNLCLSGEIVSIRKNSMGRGVHLGIVFKKGQKTKILEKYWNSLKLHKKNLKKRSLAA